MDKPINILFLSCMYSETQILEFQEKSRKGFQFAAQNLQGAIVDGFLEHNVKLDVLTIPSLSTFPLGYKSPIVNDAEFVWKGESIGASVGFTNLPILRKPVREKIWSYINSWFSSSSSQKYVVVYGLHKQLMSIALEIKAKKSSVRTCQIVPDLPRYMACNKWYRLLGLQKRDTRYIYSMVKHFDSFVLLSEPMANDLCISEKPYTIVEGIFSQGRDSDCHVSKDAHKAILYTGNLNNRYGILNLLDAFSQIKSSEYRLWIRGEGNTKDEVIRRSRLDNRIVYYDRMSIDELRKLQQRATLLVNPVPPSAEFTRYFFPSKTMDYMASGTPTLMFNLECLPSEYKDYLYLFSKNDCASIKDMLITICSKHTNDLEMFGKKAQHFIITEKNPYLQVDRILNLLRSI